MSAIGSFVLGVALWFAALCLIGLAFEVAGRAAAERRRVMRARIARHVTGRSLS
jgi:hypothetical protein